MIAGPKNGDTPTTLASAAYLGEFEVRHGNRDNPSLLPDATLNLLRHER